VTTEGFLIAFCANSISLGSFGFAQTIIGFLIAPGLRFVDMFSENRITSVFAKRRKLFGRRCATAIVL
jgi:hypothetical protein